MTILTIHTDTLFDPKLKAFVNDVSLSVDTETGLIAHVFHREEALDDHVQKPDIDLRGKVVCPGFVDAHTHIFLHSYESVEGFSY